MDESNTTKYAGKLALPSGFPASHVVSVFSTYSGVSFSRASHTPSLILVGGFAQSVVWLRHFLAKHLRLGLKTPTGKLG